jgi:subtilisin family serine protease
MAVSLLRKARSRRVSLAILVVLSIVCVVAGTASGSLRAGSRARLSVANSIAPPSHQPIDRRSVHAPAEVFDRLAATAATKGSVNVIVGLRTLYTPEEWLDASQVAAQRQEIGNARDGLVRGLSGTDFSVVRSYDDFPYLALHLTPQSLSALRESGNAATIEDDLDLRPTLFESTRITEAAETTALGRTGATSQFAGISQYVAIIDSGVDRTHPFLQQANGQSKVIGAYEACFNSSTTSKCPDGTAKEVKVLGAAAPCNYAAAGNPPTAKCDHGTHVAGIAVGRNGSSGGKSFNGVAPGANLIAIQVDHKDAQTGLPSAFNNDILGALGYVKTLCNYDSTTGRCRVPIAAVNISLGSPPTGSGNCDTDFPSFAQIFQELHDLGIAVVVAAGNDASNTAVGFPACIAAAVTVGATTDQDTVSAFSDSSNEVDLLAPGGRDSDSNPNSVPDFAGDDPGTQIVSSIPVAWDTPTLHPGDNTADGFTGISGTSQAAPHVAGAFAVLRGVDPTAYLDSMVSVLRNTGKPVLDPLSGVTSYRIRLLAATVNTKDTGFKTAESFTFQGGDVVSNGIGLAVRGGAPTVNTIPLSVPSDATVQHAYLYWMTIGGPDSTAIITRTIVGVPYAAYIAGSTATPSVLVGASRNTGEYINEYGPIRVYRAELPASFIVTGTTPDPQHPIPEYGLKGIDSRRNGADGEGASLLVIYSRPSTQTGRIVIRQGAMTALSGEMMIHLFSGLSVPSTPTKVRLHVGIGDGESGTANAENPMKFNGATITAANAFFGANGPQWDAKTISIASSALPINTTSAYNVLKSNGDTLAWAYAVLAYQSP